MMTTPYTHKQPLERQYTIRGAIKNQPIALTMSGMNVLDVIARAQRQYPELRIVSVHLEKK